MKIDNNLIKESLGVDLKLGDDIFFENLGLVDSKLPNSLTYIRSSKFIKFLANNKNIKACLCSENEKIAINDLGIFPIVVEDPEYSYFSIYNHIAKKRMAYEKTVISKTAKIHPSAVISPIGVNIGENVQIGANVVVEAGTSIGDNTRILANTTLGCMDSEVKNTPTGMLVVEHDGELIIGKNCFIGANCVVDRGLHDNHTVLKDGVVLSNRVYVGHTSKIGERTILLGCTICGSCDIGKNVRVSIGAIVSNGIRVKDGAIVSIGAVVVEDVEEKIQVSGNFAMPHNKFLKHFSKISKL